MRFPGSLTCRLGAFAATMLVAAYIYFPVAMFVRDVPVVARLYASLAVLAWDWSALAMAAVRLAALIIVAWGIGGPVTRWMRTSGQVVPLTGRTILGLFVFSSFLLALGLGGLVFRWVVVAGLVLAMPLAGFELRRVRLSLPVIPKEGWALVIALIIIPTILVGLLVCGGLLAPENFWDALVYHLAGPNRWVAEHKVFATTPFFTNFPFMVQSLSLLLLPWGGELLPRMFQALSAGACALVIWDVGRMLGFPRAGAFAAVSFLTTPLVCLLATHAGVDLAFAWFALVGLAAFMRAFPRWPDGRTSSAPRIVLAGVLAGVACSAKYHGVAVVGLLTLAVLALRQVSWRRRAVICIFLLAGVCVPSGIYTAKSVALTGNPVYPFFSETISSTGWTAAAAETYADELAGGNPFSRAGAATEGYARALWIGLLGPLALLGLGLVWGKHLKVAGFYLVFAAGYVGLWTFSVPIMRFVLPAWGAYLFVVFAGAATLERARRGWVLIVLVTVHLVSAIVWLPQIIYAVDAPWPYLRGEELREGYYGRVQRNAPWDARACLPARAPLGPRNRVLCLGEYRGYLVGPWATTGSLFEPDTFSQLAHASPTSRDLARKLKQRGYRYLLVNEVEIARRAVWENGRIRPTMPIKLVEDFFAHRLALVYASRGMSIYEVVGPGEHRAVAPEALYIEPGSHSAALLSMLDRARHARGGGRAAEALRLSWLTVSLASSSAMAWVSLGDSLSVVGERSQAVGAYETALKYGAHDSAVYANLGWAYESEKRYGLARQSFERALELDPAARRARMGLTKLNLRLRRIARSLKKS